MSEEGHELMAVGQVFLPRTNFAQQESCRTIVESEVLRMGHYISQPSANSHGWTDPGASGCTRANPAAVWACVCGGCVLLGSVLAILRLLMGVQRQSSHPGFHCPTYPRSESYTLNQRTPIELNTSCFDRLVQINLQKFGN